MPKFQFIDGQWEIDEGDGFGPVDRVDTIRLAGYTAYDGVVFTGPGLEPQTLAQLEGSRGAETVNLQDPTVDLRWWPRDLATGKLFVSQTTAIFDPLSETTIERDKTQSEILEVFDRVKAGEWGFDFLPEDWKARIQPTDKQGPLILEDVFTSDGTKIPGQGRIEGTNNIVKFDPALDLGEVAGIETTIPVPGTDKVIHFVPGQPPKYLDKAQSPETASVAQLMDSAVRDGDFDRARELGRILNQPQTLQALTAAELEKNTPDGERRAQQLFDFANQTTKQEAMELALKFARSPADSLIWDALTRGRLLEESGRVPATPAVEQAFAGITAGQQAAESRVALVEEAVEPVGAPAERALRPEGTPQGVFDRQNLETFGRLTTLPEPANLPNRTPLADPGFGPVADFRAGPQPGLQGGPDVRVAPQINQQPDTGLDAARVAATQAGAPGQAPRPEPTDQFDSLRESFGSVLNEQGESVDIRVAPRVRAAATGQDIDRFDANTLFRDIGIKAGLGPNFRPISMSTFFKLSPGEQQELVGAAEALRIDRETFFQAMRGATPGGGAQGAPRIGATQRRGLS